MTKLVTLLVLCYVCVDVARAKDLKEADLPPQVEEMMRNLHDKCVAETGISESEIIEARDGRFSGSQTLKNYLGCEFFNLGLVDENGVWNKEAHLEVAPEQCKETLKKIMDTCKLEDFLCNMRS